MKLKLSKSGDSCSMLGSETSATLYLKQVGDATYGEIYQGYIPVKLGAELGLIVKWPLGEDVLSWKDVTIEGSVVCNDMTPKGEPVEFSVVKNAKASDISLKSSEAEVEISVEKVLDMFRLSTQNFSGGEPNNLGFEAVDITSNHLEIVIIPNEALELGVRGKITSDSVGQFGKEQDTLLMAQHITDNAYPAVALLHESPASDAESFISRLENLGQKLSNTPRLPKIDFMDGQSKYALIVSTDDIPNVNLPFLKELTQQYSCKDCSEAVLKEGFYVYFNASDTGGLLEGEPGNETPEPEEVDLEKELKKVPKVDKITINREIGKRSVNEHTRNTHSKSRVAHAHKKSSIQMKKIPNKTTKTEKLVEEEVVDAHVTPIIQNVDIMSNSYQEADAATSRSDVGKETPNNVFGKDTEMAMAVNADKVQTDSNPTVYMNHQSSIKPVAGIAPSNASNKAGVRSGGTSKILMYVKFKKDEIKIFTHSRLKGTVVQIKNFAISSIKDREDKTIPFAKGDSKLYFESIAVSGSEARLKAKTTTSHELVPHLLILKNMSVVVVIKKEADQFMYDDFDYEGEGNQGVLDRELFVRLVQINGESFVEGQLNYFDVYNMTDLLQTDVINEKYKKDFVAIYNISFTELFFRTRLTGDTVMRVYGLAKTFSKDNVLVEGMIFMKNEDPKKHLALGFVADDIKYSKMLENIYGKYMSNFPWVTMSKAGIVVSREKDDQISFENPILHDAYSKAGKDQRELSGCEYQPGDGVATKEKAFIGYALDRRDCALKCFDRSRVNPAINGATFDIVKKKWCFCQHELSGFDATGKGAMFSTCKFELVENHEGIYFSGKVGMPSSCQGPKDAAGDSYCRYFFDKMQSFTDTRITGHFHPNVVVVKSDELQSIHYLLESAEGKAQALLTASRLRIYKQNGIDETDVTGQLNLFNGKNGAGFQATISRGRLHGHLQAFLYSNSESHLFVHPAITLEPAIGYAKIEDQKLSHVDFSQSPVYIGKPMPARDNKDNYESKEAFKKRIGPRVKLSETVIEFHASNPSNNLLHGHLKELSYKKILEAFEVGSKVGDVAMFKDAVFSDVTYVAYAVKETYLPSKNTTIPAGLHFIGELKAELSEDVFERPADQPRKLTAPGEERSKFQFDLPTDVEVKEDGLYWKIRLPRLNTSDGMFVMQAHNESTQSGPMLKMITYFDDRPMLPTVVVSGYVITVGMAYKGKITGFVAEDDAKFVFEKNEEIFGYSANARFEGDSYFRHFKLSATFRKKSEGIVKEFKKRTRNELKKWILNKGKTTIWSVSLSSIMAKITKDKNYLVLRRIMALAKSMKNLERQIQRAVETLNEDCVDKCKLDKPAWVLNQDHGTYTDMQIEKIPSGVEWILDPACLVECEVDKAEAEKDKNHAKRRIKALKPIYLKYSRLSKRFNVALRYAHDMKRLTDGIKENFLKQTGNLPMRLKEVDSYDGDFLKILSVTSDAVEMNVKMRQELPCLQMDVKYEYMGKADAVEDVYICVNGEFGKNIAEVILLKLYPILKTIDDTYSRLELTAVKVKDKADVLKDLIKNAELVSTMGNDSKGGTNRSKRPDKPKQKGAADQLLADGNEIAPLHQRVLDRVDNLTKTKTPPHTKRSYRTKTALDHYGPWASLTLKPRVPQTQHSINTTISAGDACTQTGEVASRFADLAYEVDDVIKNYARHKIAVNKTQTSIMQKMQQAKDRIDRLEKSGRYTRSEMNDIRYWYFYSNKEIENWMQNSGKEFNQYSNTAIGDHFKNVDQKVQSKFSSGTKGYVNYLSSEGSKFANKLASNSKSTENHMKQVAQGLASLLHPAINIETAIPHVERLKRSISHLQGHLSNTCT